MQTRKFPVAVWPLSIESRNLILDKEYFKVRAGLVAMRKA